VLAGRRLVELCSYLGYVQPAMLFPGPGKSQNDPLPALPPPIFDYPFMRARQFQNCIYIPQGVAPVCHCASALGGCLSLGRPHADSTALSFKQVLKTAACEPTTRISIIGEWLHTEARFLAA
jgi:hypothetical protein